MEKSVTYKNLLFPKTHYDHYITVQVKIKDIFLCIGKVMLLAVTL